MADGLFLAYTDPGPVPDDEFHDWYDNEHLPARLTVPGFASAARYRAADGQAPPWLAVYEIEPGTLDTPAYKALYAHQSDREKSLMPRLATLERREYEKTDEWPAARPAGSGGPGPAILIVSISVPPGAEGDLNAWYAEEHAPMLLAIPGWRRIRRYRQVFGTGPENLALHDLDDPGILDSDAFKAAVSTPWRDRVMGGATAVERRVFTLYKTFG
ncbi:MAG: hypothetical protein J2P25_06695 [Nocardiopsaceae bacterium]|nr:hypothetical protein [Nocardiopsaceae bacterium]